MKAGSAMGDREAAGTPSRTASMRLRPRPGSAGSARHFTSTVLATWLVADHIAQDVLLAVSELVTNAVEHGAGEIVLELVNQANQCLRVQVSDQGLGAGPVLVPLSPATSRSRGLAIVAAVSTEWGHRADGSGLVVWAEFALARVDPV